MGVGVCSQPIDEQKARFPSPGPSRKAGVGDWDEVKSNLCASHENRHRQRNNNVGQPGQVRQAGKADEQSEKNSQATRTAKHVCQVDQVDQVGSLEMRLGGMACFRFPSVTRFLKSWSRQGNLGEEEGVEPGTFRGP